MPLPHNSAPSPVTALAEVQDDLDHCADATEFPLSSMSRKIAHFIGRLTYCRRKGFALDVGTGSGVHAIILSKMGYSCVLGVDSNAKAVDLALRRAIRLGLPAAPISPNEIAGHPDGWGNAKVWFCPSPLQELNRLLFHRPDVIVFNPPSFFFKSPVNASSPISTGVYCGSVVDPLDVQGSLLYQFFGSVVLPLLAIGGDLVCSWPGLERRSVEIDPMPDQAGSSVHPASMLAHWFGLNIATDDEDPANFYKYTAIISDYGLGDAFWLNFHLAQEDTRCYSELLFPRDSLNGDRAAFRFGVLHLTRTGVNSFTVNSAGESDE